MFRYIVLIMRQFILFLFLYFSFIFSSAVAAQDSLILSIIEQNQSIVTVRAIKQYRPQSIRGKFFWNPKTNRIIRRSKIKVPTFERRGAGVIIDDSGLIITNLHTIIGSEKIIVRLLDGTEYDAEVVHMMQQRDLALLKITAREALTAIPFTKDSQLKLGQKIINVGHSELLHQTISGGRITRLGRNSKNGRVIEFIQVNINLYKGDSGGPVLDEEGNLVGIIVADVRGVDHASIAVSADKIKELYQDFLQNN